MKKLLLVCCIVLGVSAASYAQGRGQQRSPQDQAAQLKTSLSLTDDQTSKITVILTAQAKSNDSLRTAANGDRQAMMQAMMPLRQKYTAQIKAVLTPDQAAAYDKEMAARRGGRGGNGGGNGGGGTPPPSNR